MLGIADVRSNIGIIWRRTGRWDDALNEYRAALALRERMGHKLGIGTVHNNIAEVYRSRGEPELAVAEFQQAVETWSSIGHALYVGLALVGLGAARVEVGDPTRGRLDLLEAERRFRDLGSTIYLPDLYRYLAEAELGLGDIEAADVAVRRSLEYATSTNARHQQGATARVQAQIALARGEFEGAREYLAVSRSILQELGDASELARTEALARELDGETVSRPA
jgi:tetratricopeptide (TPR) repeat protein